MSSLLECEPAPLQPKPLGAEANGAIFPVSSLPPPLADLVIAVAESTQTPTDLSGIITLAVASAACAGVVEVSPIPGWVEPTNLYLVVAMEPGERKSPVVRKLLGPVHTRERELQVSLSPEVRKRDVERRVLEQTKAHAEKCAATAHEASRRKSALAEAQRAADELAKKPPLPMPRLLADDATAESYSKLLAEHRRIAILSGESDLFEILAGRYSDGNPNIGVFLNGHCGDPMLVDRMGRSALRIESPAITIGITTQPSVINDLAAKRAFGGRGLLARFLYSFPRSKLGSRKLNPDAVPASVGANYEATMGGLFRRLGLPGGGKPRLLTADGAGRAVFDEFRAEIERRLAPGGDLRQFAGWGSKLPGAVARIAGVLHEAQAGGSSVPPVIGADTWRSAIALGYYFLAHARSAFDLMAVGPLLDDARDILEWIRREEVYAFTAGECYRANRQKGRDQERIHEALDTLVDHRYLIEDAGDPDRGPGRPTRSFRVHGSLHLRAGGGFNHFYQKAEGVPPEGGLQ